MSLSLAPARTAASGARISGSRTTAAAHHTAAHRPAAHHTAAHDAAERLWQKLARFAGIGGVATAAQLGMFAVLITVIPQVWANVLSWSLSTVVANAANRSVTFDVHGSDGARRDFLISTAFSLVGLGASMTALSLSGDGDPIGSIVVLVAVNGVVGIARFSALRRWFAVRPV